MSRATSTVVDATVFLLLVGGAIGTLVAGTGDVPPPSGESAAATAEVLATTTAAVEYSVETAETDANPVAGADDWSDRATTRRTHGTLAALLGDAAVTGARIDGTHLSPVAPDYGRSVGDAVANGTGRPMERTAVRAVWEPYPDAPLAGVVAVGDEPPPDADVHAASLEVGSGVDPVSDRTLRTDGASGYHDVARAVADAVVTRFLAPNATRLALRGDYPTDVLAAQRFRRARAAVGIDSPAPDRPAAARTARITSALADRIATDLRERYDSPDAAAADVDVETVRISVRTWSP